MFWTIYFDTEPLWTANWPRLTTEFREFLTLANQLGIQIVIPDPVYAELQGQWNRESADAHNDIVASTGTMKTRLRNIGYNYDPSVQLPEMSLVNEKYRQRVEEIINQFSLQTSPYPKLSLKDFHQITVDRLPPYRPKEKGPPLGDGVIFLSAIEHFETETEQLQSAFVSNDKRFHEATIRQYIKDKRLALTLFKTIDDARSEIEAALEATQQKLLELDQSRLMNALEAARPELERYIQDNLEFSERDLGSFLHLKLSRVLGLTVKSIPRAVALPIAWRRQETETVEISATAVVAFDVVIEPNPFWSNSGEPIKNVKGETVGFRVPVVPDSPVENTLERDVRIAAKAVYRENAFKDVTFEQVWLSTQSPLMNLGTSIVKIPRQPDNE